MFLNKILSIIFVAWIGSGCFGSEPEDPFANRSGGDEWWWLMAPNDQSTNNEPLEKITLCVGEKYVYPKPYLADEEQPKYISRLQSKNLVTVTREDSDEPIEYTMKVSKAYSHCHSTGHVGNIGIDLHFTPPLPKGDYSISAKYVDGSEHRNLFTFGVSNDQPPKLLRIFIYENEDDSSMSFSFSFSEPVYFPFDGVASGPQTIFTKRDQYEPSRHYRFMCNLCGEKLIISTESITSLISNKSLAPPTFLEDGVRAYPDMIEITFDELSSFLVYFD